MQHKGKNTNGRETELKIMSTRSLQLLAIAVTLWLVLICRAAEPTVLPGTRPLEDNGDRSAQMVAAIDRFLMEATDRSIAKRRQFWQRDFSTPTAYTESVDGNRQSLRTIIGAVDGREQPVKMEYVCGTDSPAVVGETDSYRVYSVRWRVFGSVHGEGLLIEPRQSARAQIVAIPDADWTPEMLAGLEPGLPQEAQFARKLAESGCRVIVPILIDRRCTWSGNPQIAMTDQTHREWVWRQAVEMGRHPIGYEVQTVLSAVDWMAGHDDAKPLSIAVAGYGEGGLIALYAAALDTRLDAALVSGYFDSRQRLWEEPIYRNVFGLLREFGDAEVASLVMPRTLIVEHSRGPKVDGPPKLPAGRRPCAAPGRLVPPVFDSVRNEVERAGSLCSQDSQRMGRIHFVSAMKETAGTAVGPGSDEAIALLLDELGNAPQTQPVDGKAPADCRPDFSPEDRQHRYVNELVQYSQRLLRRAEGIRAEFWKDARAAKSSEHWNDTVQPYRQHLWDQVVGRLPDPNLPPDPRARKIDESAKWTMYEVMLDVWPDVFAWGYLLVPKGIQPGERRPVVVCQHGLEGLPESVVTEDTASRAFHSYRAYAVRLAERGFITYAPHNPYRGETAFRQLQRKANPLGLTLYSFILGQHHRTLEWLSQLPFVDSKRIAFYGLSYGGLSAVRIPSLLEGYALSICSACFNDWTRKIMSLDFRASYMFTREYDHFTFNLGSTFNHAELAALVAPRPFMVERGHRDGVAPDEWVAYEYAKVRRRYAELGIPDRTTIEFFNGGHIIQGEGTFDFLHRHLQWPPPAGQRGSETTQ